MKEIRIWVDDCRPAPAGYYSRTSVNAAIGLIHNCMRKGIKIALLDLDHDAGEFADRGGDYIKILDWMEREGINDIPIRIHSMNPVGVANMRSIIKKNGWMEIR